MAFADKASGLLDLIHSLRFLRGANDSSRNTANAMLNRHIVHRDRQVHQEIEDWTESLGSQGQMEDPGFLVLAFSMAQVRVVVASSVQQDHLALAGLMDLQDHQDPTVDLELREQEEDEAYLDPLDLLVMQDQMVHLDRWDRLVHLELAA